MKIHLFDTEHKHTKVEDGIDMIAAISLCAAVIISAHLLISYGMPYLFNLLR